MAQWGGLPDLTIVQNPHAHCANHENHNVIEFARVQCCRGGSHRSVSPEGRA